MPGRGCRNRHNASAGGAAVTKSQGYHLMGVAWLIAANTWPDQVWVSGAMGMIGAAWMTIAVFARD